MLGMRAEPHHDRANGAGKASILNEISRKTWNISTREEPDEGEDEGRCDGVDADDGRLGEEDGDVTREAEICGDVRVRMLSSGCFHLLHPFALAHPPPTSGIDSEVGLMGGE